MRLLPKHTHVSGRITIDGTNILTLKKHALSSLRGETVAMIFQEPMSALDPVYTVGQHMVEMIRRHTGLPRSRAIEYLRLVKIPSPERRFFAYPHELSGGLRQRVVIAMALCCQPSLLLADEPTTALDATVQIQILILLRRLQQELSMGTIFVTHDIGAAAQIADRIAVMYAGKIIEQGSAFDVLNSPAHPYTIGLLSSRRLARGCDIPVIPGSPPDINHLPARCSFAPRCSFAVMACLDTPPPAHVVQAGHNACCIRAGEIFRALRIETKAP